MISTIAVSAGRREHGWELYVDGEVLSQSMTLADAAQTARDALATERGGEPDDYVGQDMVRLTAPICARS